MGNVSVAKKEKAHEIQGKLAPSDGDKLMRTVLGNDKKAIDEGSIIQESVNRGIGALTPDDMMQNLVHNFSMAERLYGKKLISLMSGYESEYVKRNVQIPEFRMELMKKLTKSAKRLKDDNLMDESGWTDDGIKLSSIIMYTEELEKLNKSNAGNKTHKNKQVDGDRGEADAHGKRKFRDLAIRKTLHTAIRRGHETILPEDIKWFDRKSRANSEILYCIDCSGSMTGQKMEMAKKAGIALCYKAIQNRDKVGIIAFGSKIEKIVQPTNDFGMLLREIASIKPRKQTDYVVCLKKAPEVFKKGNQVKHIILLSDAMPNVGKHPEKDTMQAISEIRSHNITVSLLGIDLGGSTEKLAQEIVRTGQGRLYKVKDADELDAMILEDYEANAQG